MYDPLVVDTFLRVYKDIAPVEEARQHKEGLSAITRQAVEVSESIASANSRLDDISASSEEMLLLYDIARALSDHLDVTDVADVIAKHLRRLVPATTCVFFVYDSDADRLTSAHASGENASHFTDIRIDMGQRLSGWVAANRRTILNSDPMLDLGEVARILRPPLRSCLSTPLVANGALVGVLTVYSTNRDAFTEDHRRIVEVVARQVSHAVRRAIDYKKEHAHQLRDQFTGLPNREHLERFWSSELSSSEGLPCSVVFLELRTVRGTRTTPHNGLLEAAIATRTVLRGADFLFAYDAASLIALLPQTDAETADAIAKRVAVQVGAMPAVGDQSPAWRVGWATSPQDGLELREVVAAAESRLKITSVNNRPSIH